MITKIIKTMLGLNKHEEKINNLKKEVQKESDKTMQKLDVVNRLIVKRSTTYFIGKAMGVI